MITHGDASGVPDVRGMDRPNTDLQTPALVVGNIKLLPVYAINGHDHLFIPLRPFSRNFVLIDLYSHSIPSSVDSSCC